MISNIVSHGGDALKRVRFSRLSGLSIESDPVDFVESDPVDFVTLLILEKLKISNSVIKALK